jgi:uncharacterized membrane protein YeaQ/YmgE (transglycosylase-associated protein family)
LAVVAVVFVVVVLLLASWGAALFLRSAGPPSIADAAAAIIGVSIGGYLVAALFGAVNLGGPFPAAFAALVGAILLIAVRGASAAGGR